MKLPELARVIRSKNASPFLTTIDIIFNDEGAFTRVRDAGVLTPERVAELYGIAPDQVLGVWFVETCLAAKVSFIKPVPSDAFESADLYGAQQHVPMLDLDIP
ncbi:MULTISPECIES: DUF4387 domain-containing protein [Limnochorda]|uniref:DUF4387 domain-containing protein n=1 Tax=Limnochorda TaxID=1676651 RepID=UPI0018485180|nr:DUF4387 domain-containing protein [Limnochorda pilosa]MBO2486256.1 DUF4387 domain-containing protein [Bacillota bacterium]MBO2518420.1 DUF4387 domain-containing protein [Bacillota bacterium]NMA70658.1 DUF4387 domain-containing protein [Bacillota bacterium]